MAVNSMVIRGKKYSLAPVEPKRCVHPSDSIPLVITPEIAKSWLRFNYRNRIQRESGKKDYSSDMLAGSFDLNGAPISFSRPLDDGEDELVPEGHVVLMDGQHRLEACVRANVPFVTYVVYGLDPAVRATIDVGISRKFQDVLAMRGEGNAIVLASVIKRVHAWENGDTFLTGKKVASTHAQLLEFFTEHPEIERDAEVAARVRRDFQRTANMSIRQSVVGLAHHLFIKADQSEAPEFFTRLGDGILPSVSHPIYLLRSRLINDQRKRQALGAKRVGQDISDGQQLGYLIRTWNAYLLWQASTDAQRESARPFMMSGRTDKERMPKIRTMEDAYAILTAEEARKERGEPPVAEDDDIAA